MPCPLIRLRCFKSFVVRKFTMSPSLGPVRLAAWPPRSWPRAEPRLLCWKPGRLSIRPKIFLSTSGPTMSNTGDLVFGKGVDASRRPTNSNGETTSLTLPPRASPEFQWFRSRIVGGRTNHYGRISLRFADYDFRGHSIDGYGDDWPITYDDIAPYYDKVERLVGVYGTKGRHPHRARRHLSAAPGAALRGPSGQAGL